MVGWSAGGLVCWLACRSVVRLAGFFVAKWSVGWWVGSFVGGLVGWWVGRLVGWSAGWFGGLVGRWVVGWQVGGWEVRLVGWLGRWIAGRLSGWSIGRLVGAMVVTITTSCTPTTNVTRQGANTSKARPAGGFSFPHTFVAETQEDGPTQPDQGTCDAPLDDSEGTESDDSHDLLASTSETEGRLEMEGGNGSSSPEHEWQDYGDSQGFWKKGVYHRYTSTGVVPDGDEEGSSMDAPSDDDKEGALSVGPDSDDEATSLFLQEESQVGEQFRDMNGDVWNVDYRIAKDCTWQIHNQATSQVEEVTTSQLEQWDRVEPEEPSSSEEKGQWISGLRIWFGGWLAVRRHGG